MDRTEFDRFADEYQNQHAENIRLSGEGPDYFARYKARDLTQVLEAQRLLKPGVRILDFGTGVGNSIPHLLDSLPTPEVIGVDVSLRSLDIARTRLGEAVPLIAFDGRTLPFGDATFQGALAACVFHHIDASLHELLLSEILRVLAPGGLLMVYEHNPFNPITVRAVNTCPFDKNAVLIQARRMRVRVLAAGFSQVRTRYRVFFPAALKAIRPLERYLGQIPFGAQYYVVGLRSP